MKKSKLIILIAGVIIMLSLFGCASGKKYKVDFDGCEASSFGAKDSYKAGQNVRFTMPMATDENLTVYLDGETLNAADFTEGEYIFTFKMPDHDVKITWNRVNTMVNTNPAEEHILVDYYEKITGTEFDRGYFEMVLAEDGSGNFTMKVYTQESGDSEEEVKTYSVPLDSDEKAFEIIEKYKMKKWNDLKNYDALDGKVMVVRFDDGGEQIRVSSEHMPADNGTKAFGELKAYLSELIDENNLIAE